MKFLNFVRRNLAVLIPVMLILGLLKGHWWPMEYSRVICVSALLVMIFPVFINLEFDKGLKEFSHAKGDMPSVMAIVSASIIMSVIVLPFIIPELTNHLMESGAVEVDKMVILEKLFFIDVSKLF